MLAVGFVIGLVINKFTPLNNRINNLGLYLQLLDMKKNNALILNHDKVELNNEELKEIILNNIQN